MTRIHAGAVLPSFAGCVAAAIAATLMIDYLSFDRAVDAREQEVRGRYQAQYADIDARLDHAISLNLVRQKMLDAKNEELRKCARPAAEIARLENRMRVLEQENERLHGRVELASVRNQPGGVQLAAGERRQAEKNSDSVAAMRAEFARRLAAEAEGRKKPKGPVYLNTPRGRVVVVPEAVNR